MTSTTDPSVEPIDSQPTAPQRLKHVYRRAKSTISNRPRSSDPLDSVPVTLNTGDVLSDTNIRSETRKTLEEEMLEIDEMADDELANLTHQFRQTPPDQDPTTHFSSRELHMSSQSSSSSLLPTSMTKSGVSLLHSPSSPGPITPQDLSPITHKAANERRKAPRALRVADSDSETEIIARPAGQVIQSYSNRSLPHAETLKVTGRIDNTEEPSDKEDHLPTLEEALAEEEAIALAEAKRELALEDQRKPVHPSPDRSPGTKRPQKNGLCRSASFFSESELLENVGKIKTKKKAKGLTKKDKEETQRIIASCQRQQNTKLTAVCKVPTTKLEDIVSKVDQIAASFQLSKQSRTSISQKIQKKPSKILTNLAKNPPTDDQPPTSPIGEFPTNHLSPVMVNQSENKHYPAELKASDDELPSLEDIFTKTEKSKMVESRANLPTKPVGSNSKLKAQSQELESDATSDSDSDLDIVGKPSNDLPYKASIPNASYSASLAKPSHRTALLRDQNPPPHKTTQMSFLPHTSQLLPSKTKPKSTNDSLMMKLRLKTAQENALLREQKQAEFIQRGGQLAKLALAQSKPEEVDFKAILRKTAENAQQDLEDAEPEDGIEDDWDEPNSGSEIELSGSEEDEEGTEDEDDEDAEDENPNKNNNEEDDAHVLEENLTSLDNMSVRSAELDVNSNSKTLVTLPLRVQGSVSSFSSSATIDMPRPGQSTARVLVPESSSVGDICQKSTTSTAESPEAEDPIINDPESGSPPDLPGFNPATKARLKRSNGPEVNQSQTQSESLALTGFALVASNKGFCGSLDGLSQFENTNVSKSKRQHDNEEGFSQLFGDEDEMTFTHPPPPLKKPKTIEKVTSGLPSIFLPDAVDGLESALPGSCMLPSVNLLPEEKERDMVIMMLGASNKNPDDGEEAAMVYINDRGLLTQNKPISDPTAPPDSPFMSQDMVARTPFALRKDIITVKRDDLMDEDGISPNQPRDDRGVWNQNASDSPSLRGGNEMPRFSRTIPQSPVRDAFSLVMKAQQPVKVRPKTGAGKLFLADQADESDDESGAPPRRNGSYDDEEEGSEEGDEVLQDLVDDDNEQDEEAKLRGDQAVEELAKAHQRQAEEKYADQIDKVVAGKVRVRQAKNQRGDGGITDSDSEDDEEAERIKANRRAQEHAAKKKKRAIHMLAEKHASFFKSYEEGTSQWADEDDVACLQPSDAVNISDDDEEPEDDEGEYDDESEQEDEPVLIRETKKRALSVESHQSLASDLDNGIVNTEGVLLSSPIRLPGVKIKDPFKNSNRDQISNEVHETNHNDIDGMYNNKVHRLTKLQMTVAAKLTIEEGSESRKVKGFGLAPSKSSSITYHQNLEQKRSLKKIKDDYLDEKHLIDKNQLILNQSSKIGRLAKLKNKI